MYNAIKKGSRATARHKKKMAIVENILITSIVLTIVLLITFNI